MWLKMVLIFQINTGPLWYDTIPVRTEDSGEGFTPPSIQDIKDAMKNRGNSKDAAQRKIINFTTLQAKLYTPSTPSIGTHN